MTDIQHYKKLIQEDGSTTTCDTANTGYFSSDKKLTSLVRK